MSENFDILAELTGAVIGAATGILAEDIKGLAWKKIKEKRLIRKIRKREKYLKSKYEKSFELLNDRGKDSFCEWLEDKRTINQILSFSNAKDVSNISMEQMQYSRECFFEEAFKEAQVCGFSEKEELRKVLNELFRYVDELFWGALDEKDVFLYKKSVGEIRELIDKQTEKADRKIEYHDSFAEYIDNQKAGQKVPFKLDYRSEEIPFVGREKEFGEIDAFCASEKQISWWAVIGKGGSGKSRLAYEYIKSNMSSAEWKMCFLREEFFSQAGGGGKYKKWDIWTYDKNLLLVVDYVQKYAKEVAQWIEGLYNSNSVTRKIRILILERTDGEQSLWMREGFEKTVTGTLKYNKDFLRLQSLDVDLIPFAVKYAEKNGRQISKADAADAWDKLKSIDADTRILYFIMILEAVFNNEPWRSWNRNDLAGYIVRREQEDIAVRFKHNKDVVRSFNRVLAFCTATKELPVFELPENLPVMIKKEIEVIKNNSGDKRELCAEMQLENGVLQPVTPDIIGEYMVLYIIDQYFFDKGEKEEFIRNLWTYDSGDFYFFVYRLFEDKMGDGAYEDITKLMLFDAVPHGDICVMEDYSNLLWRIVEISDLNQALVLVDILEKLYHDCSLDEIIACSYANGLVKLCDKQEYPQAEESVEKLRKLAVENGLNSDIQALYARGLLDLSDKQEQPEREATIEELRKLAVENAKIQTIYAVVLLHLSRQQERMEIDDSLEELEGLLAQNGLNAEIQLDGVKNLFSPSCKQEQPEAGVSIEKLVEKLVIRNAEIQTIYAMVLFDLSYGQEQPEIEVTIEELEKLVIRNIKIQTMYARILFNLKCKPEQLEKEEIKAMQRKLGNELNAGIQILYARGLFNLSLMQGQPERKATIEKLRKLAVTNGENTEIQEIYADSLVQLSNKQEQPEKEETIEELRRLAIENRNNAEIQTAYALGLFLLSHKQEQPKIKETIEELRKLVEENVGNGIIQTAYAAGLLNLSGKQELPEMGNTVEEMGKLAVGYVENTAIQTRYIKCRLQRLTKGNMINNKKMDCQPYRKRRPAVKRAAFLRDRERRKTYKETGPK